MGSIDRVGARVTAEALKIDLNTAWRSEVLLAWVWWHMPVIPDFRRLSKRIPREREVRIGLQSEILSHSGLTRWLKE